MTAAGLTDWHREQAAKIAEAVQVPAAPDLTKPLTDYRVVADWEGGGFSITLPFADEAEAHEYARLRSRFHRGVEISVTPRDQWLFGLAQRDAEPFRGIERPEGMTVAMERRQQS